VGAADLIPFTRHNHDIFAYSGNFTSSNASQEDE